MPSSSEIILSQIRNLGDSTTETITGAILRVMDTLEGPDGVHTVHDFTGLTGTITIQGTLATSPSDTDWFHVHTYTASNETAVKYANFTGNFVYIRAKVVYNRWYY